MKDKQKKELAVSKVLLLLLALVGILFVVWYAWIRPDESSGINSFETCKDAGRPILESYPERCLGPDGTSYTNPRQLPINE